MLQMGMASSLVRAEKGEVLLITVTMALSYLSVPERQAWYQDPETEAAETDIFTG